VYICKKQLGNKISLNQLLTMSLIYREHKNTYLCTIGENSYKMNEAKIQNC